MPGPQSEPQLVSGCYLPYSEALLEELAEQVSSDGIVVFLVKRVTEYLTCLLRTDSQLCQTRKCLYWCLAATTLTAPIYQINNFDKNFPYSLRSVSISIFVFSKGLHTVSHCSHVCESGTTPMALQRVCHAAMSSSAPCHLCNSVSNAFRYLFQASTDGPSSRRQPSCFCSLA